LESKTEVGKTSYDAVLENADGITTRCRFQCGVAEVNRALLYSSWLFVEFFMLKWSVRP